jgi:hypothetical protein
MKKTFCTLCIALILAACANPIWVKAGAKDSDLDADRETCEQSVLAAGGDKAGTTHCTMNGVCQVDGFGPGYREQLFNKCMEANGWTMQQPKQGWAPDWL